MSIFIKDKLVSLIIFIEPRIVKSGMSKIGKQGHLNGTKWYKMESQFFSRQD
jgi:hypothetical protein